MGRAIAIATPFFFLLIAIEFGWARLRGREAYRLNDAVNSLSLGVLSQIANLFFRVLNVGIYSLVFAHVALAAWPADAWWAWALAIVFYDFCYYWEHRLGHRSAVFWASHVVHHQSQCYNLSTALRQTSSSALLTWIFFMPMAVAGVPPEMFAVAAVVDLLYQYWIHTELVGKLGWFDRWFASPSNHRVHHAVNDRYIDRNYGGIFMAWDRMFGTFVEEGERCVYGTRAQLDSWDPLWANLQVYAELARKSWRTRGLRNKALVWLKPPGWQSALEPGPQRGKPAFDVTTVTRYDPPMSRGRRWYAAIHLVAAVLATVPLLWYSDAMNYASLAVCAAALVTVLWLTGAVMQGRVTIMSALLAEVAAIALAHAGVTAAGAAPRAPPAIVDDADVQRAVAAARAEFLSGQPFDRFQVTVLVAGRNRAPDCLDEHARPMIVASDNVAAGHVVDAVSGATNGPVAGADVDAWIERRRYTERVLARAGLLGNQRLFTKTYPTNSGEEPADLEQLA